MQALFFIAYCKKIRTGFRAFLNNRNIHTVIPEMSHKPWGILPESQPENALEFRTFLSSSFVLEVVMREEDQGFRVSCTLQSRFPHRVTWVLQHLQSLGFCAVCKCMARV